MLDRGTGLLIWCTRRQRVERFNGCALADKGLRVVTLRWLEMLFSRDGKNGPTVGIDAPARGMADTTKRAYRCDMKTFAALVFATLALPAGAADHYRCLDASGRLQPEEVLESAETEQRRCFLQPAPPITVVVNPNPALNPKTPADLRACIAYWQRYIDQQKRIERATGVVDAHVLYVAGVQRVNCEDRLAELTARR